MLMTLLTCTDLGFGKAPNIKPAKKEVKTENKEEKEICTGDKNNYKALSRKDVYRNVPFKAGEESKYTLLYSAAKVHVGYGIMKVLSPLKYPVAGKGNSKVSVYHRVFQAEAYTGDWYKLIFAGHDKVHAISRPWDFSISKFYIQQNEKKPFSSPTQVEKWLEFDHANCGVKVREKDHTRKREWKNTYFLKSGAIDVYGALYKLRTIDYKVGTKVNLLVYTSEKNWELEAHPIAIENIDVSGVIYETVKLKMKTYIGKALQQKGNFYIWIATKHPNRPLVKVEADVAFGSIYLHLEKFKAGS